MKKSLGPKTLMYPAPVLVIGSYDGEDKANAMTASWAAAYAVSGLRAVAIRKATYTYGNISEREAFTVSIPSENNIKAADYFRHGFRKGGGQIQDTRSYGGRVGPGGCALCKGVPPGPGMQETHQDH